jgi:hypothetical protein
VRLSAQIPGLLCVWRIAYLTPAGSCVVFATKPLEWQYEKERRLLTDATQHGKGPVLRPYPADAVKEIIVGERMPPAYREQLLEVIRSALGDVPVTTARRSMERYAIIID